MIFGHIYSMKVQLNKLKVTNIFDVSLAGIQWSKVKELRNLHEVSYSWVVRLCLFKFVAMNGEWNDQLKQANYEETKLRQNKNNINHRHKLCLYGDDALQVRVIAYKLGLTVTQLVRLSLQMYIHELYCKISKDYLVNFGIKILKTVMDYRYNLLKRPFSRETYRPYRSMRGFRYWVDQRSNI